MNVHHWDFNLSRPVNIRSSIKSSKGFNIKKQCSRRLIIFARNNVKQIMYFHSLKVNTMLATIMLYPSSISILFKVSMKFQKKNNLRKRQTINQTSLVNFWMIKKHKPFEKSTNYVKEPISNLMNKDIPGSFRSLLNHRPKYVPSSSKIMIMDIITST